MLEGGTLADRDEGAQLVSRLGLIQEGRAEG